MSSPQPGRQETRFMLMVTLACGLALVAAALLPEAVAQPVGILGGCGTALIVLPFILTHLPGWLNRLRRR